MVKKAIFFILIIGLSVLCCKKKDTASPKPQFNSNPSYNSADLYINGTLFTSFTVGVTGYEGSAASTNYSFSVSFPSKPANGKYPLSISSNNPTITISSTNNNYYSCADTAIVTNKQGTVPYVTVSFSNAKFTDLNGDTITASGAISY